MSVQWVTENRYMALYVITRSERGLSLSRIANQIAEEFGKDISMTTVAKSLTKLRELGLVQKDSNKVYYTDTSTSAVVDHLAEVRGIVEKSGEADG